MTEAEKRKLALQFMAQEQARLASSTFRDHVAAQESETHQRIATRQQYYNDFAKQGITIQEFQRAYNDAYEQGRSDMLAYIRVLSHDPTDFSVTGYFDSKHFNSLLFWCGILWPQQERLYHIIPGKVQSLHYICSRPDDKNHLLSTKIPILFILYLISSVILYFQKFPWRSPCSDAFLPLSS